MTIYVETRIQGSIDELWRLTQSPEQHERWDLRFSSITYEKRASDGAPQRFRYATRLGFGLEIEGWGETAGEQAEDGTRTSALKFGSDSRWSLIRSGSGYWKYVPTSKGVRFITGYDYDVRWGAFGRALDALMFRPLIGWATAWSFDRLRLWIDAEAEPQDASRRAVMHGLSALALGFVWAWHGLVPKLLWLHPDELAMLVEAGVAAEWSPQVARVLGLLELGLGLAFVPLSRTRWPWVLTIVAMVAATAGVLVHSPERALAAFGPVTLNLLLVTVALIGILSLKDLPSAIRCLRRPPASDTGPTP